MAFATTRQKWVRALSLQACSEIYWGGILRTVKGAGEIKASFLRITGTLRRGLRYKLCVHRYRKGETYSFLCRRQYLIQTQRPFLRPSTT